MRRSALIVQGMTYQPSGAVVAAATTVRFGSRIGDPADVARWAAVRDPVRRAVLTRGWNGRVGAYTGAFGSDQLDAAVLMMPLVGFLPAADPRIRATMEALERRLPSDGEQIAPATGEQVGNFPQAFSHLGLINAAARITDAAATRSRRRS